MDAGFRIELPGKPEVGDPEQSVTNYGIAVSTVNAEVVLGERQFVVSHSVFEDVMGDNETMLMLGRENLLRDESRVLRDEQTLWIDEENAMQLVIDVPTQNVTVVVLAVSIGRNMYRATYVGPIGTEASPDVQRFLGSLRLPR